MVRFLWLATRGFRLRPWASPYLRWRIETYWGLHAGAMSDGEVLRFMWQHRADMMRFLRWAGRLRAAA